MRVASSTSTPSPVRRTQNRSSLILKIVVATALFAAYSGVLILFGMGLFRALQSNAAAMGSPMSFRAAPQRVATAAKNHLTALKRNEPFDRLHIDIKFKHLEKLREKRREAMGRGLLIAMDDDFVPASIRFGERSVDTELRLKGDVLDHLAGDKWSFRVKVKRSDHLFGMRRFSIQAPAVRDFHAEPIFLSHLRREGVLAPRYQFVEVSVNGKDIGVMALEEHFSKELLESQQRREGVILRFDESDFWRNLSLNGTFGPFGNPHISTFTPFGGSAVAESPVLRGDLAAAIGLMRGFLSGQLTPAEVFDVELMARFMAVCEVWQAHHPLAWHNMRFYFNPLTTRFEPVGFDGNIQTISPEPGLIAMLGGFTPMLLADPEFRAVFTRTLSRIAAEMADGQVAKFAREQEEDLVPRLQEGLEYIQPLHLDSLMPRAEDLATINDENFDFFLAPLGSPKMQFPEPLKAYLCTNCATPRIEFVNALPVPVVVDSIVLSRKLQSTPSAREPFFNSAMPIEIPATKPMQAATLVSVEIESAADLAHFDIDFVVHVVHQSDRHTIRTQPYFDVVKASPIPSATIAEALAKHPFLTLSKSGDSLEVGPGIWDVMNPLVIPDEMGLQLSAGTQLRFGAGGYLVSSGPLRFEGTAERPIKLSPRPGVDTWGGLISLRSDSPHVWRHVVVESTAGIGLKGWRLTGGVTLRAAEIQISDSRFVGHRGEDALNMIRSRFNLRDVEFHDTASDALDADFSNGEIHGGRFSHIGGDGIDVSGADIEVNGTLLEDVTDKAISVGEASRLKARNVRIERVSIAATSKDASRLTFEDSYVGSATTAGVSVFTKKPVYGPAFATVNRVEMHNVATAALVQSGSQAIVDGVAAPEQSFDTETLY